MGPAENSGWVLVAYASIKKIVDVTGRTKKDIEEEINNVQRSRHLDNNTRAWIMLKSIFFNNQACIRRRWKCSGVKHCPYIHPNIAAIEITTVD